MFFHDLQCLSGFGDRLLDLWAAMSIARLHEPACHVAVGWSEQGLEYSGFVGDYSTELFAMDRCEFVRERPDGAVAVERDFSDTELSPVGIVSLASGGRQVILRSGKHWGANNPERVLGELEFYELDPETTLDQLVSTYRAQAHSLAPAKALEQTIPADIEQRVGIHVRLHDKLVEEETSFEMAHDTWRAIELGASFYIERCIAGGEPLFVCSDDLAYRDALAAGIEAKGGDVVVVEPGRKRRRPPGFEALADFFALSRCSRVVQMTKYSTFSIAAALVGGKPLVNFFKEHRGAGHRLDCWTNTLGRVSIE